MRLVYTKDGVEKTCKVYYCRKHKVPDVDEYTYVTFCGQEFPIYRSYRKSYKGGSGFYLYLNYDGRWWYMNDEDFYYKAGYSEGVEISLEDVPSWEKTEGKPRRRSTTLNVEHVFVSARTHKIGAERADEKNDCTVLAMVSAFDVPYDTAHLLLEQQGRQRNKGFRFISWLYQIKNGPGELFGKKVEHVQIRPNITVGTFVKENRVGTYILSVRGHVNVLKDGKIVDTGFQPRCRLLGAFRIV